MAASKSALLLVAAVLLLAAVSSAAAGHQRHLLESLDCGAECSRRCTLSSRPNLCNRACGTCCARCGCVPPGTAGGREVCPCYNNQTTHGGAPKCP